MSIPVKKCTDGLAYTNTDFAESRLTHCMSAERFVKIEGRMSYAAAR